MVTKVSQSSERFKEYLEMVKFEHTIFALPFALSAMLLACAYGEWPAWVTVGLILLAMVGGRTYAMALNRLIDAEIDGMNPRTQDRAIPAGRVNKSEAWLLVILSALLLTWATFQLPIICQQLLPVAFIILTVYSFMKRFSPLSHLVLGVALGASAVGGWLAVTGTLSWLPVIFGFAVVFWVMGFDVIYALQDEEFDREAGLHSIPAAVGAKSALWLSRLFHVLTVLLMITFAWLYSYAGVGLWLAVLLMAGMLFYEHWLIVGKEGIRMEKINAAFFTLNGQISLGVMVLILVDKFLQG